jgi:hypothetical protein
MLICLIFFILSPLCFWIDPIKRLSLITQPVHGICLRAIPLSKHQQVYQAIFCGEKLFDPQNIIKSSGMIHLFVISAFEIYLIHRFAIIMFHKNKFRNMFLVVSVLSFLSLTAFHPAALRPALLLFLKEFNFQQKLFWSNLQLAIFSGFLCLSIQTHLIENYSLLIGWAASMAYAYFLRHHSFVKNFASYLCLLPLLKGMIIPHPLLALFFSFTTRTFLALLFPVCFLFCFVRALQERGELFWRTIFETGSKLEQFFSPLDLGTPLSLVQCWIYLLSLMTLFLFQERRRLSQ